MSLVLRARFEGKSTEVGVDAENGEMTLFVSSCNNKILSPSLKVLVIILAFVPISLHCDL